MHTEWTKGYLAVLQTASEDQRQDAANESLRSLGEHIHHQRECYENISLIVGIKHSGSLVTQQLSESYFIYISNVKRSEDTVNLIGL